MGTPKTFAGPGPKPLKHFPPEPAKLGFNFEISIFFNFCGGSLPQRGGISAKSLVHFVEPRTVNKSCKFCASVSYCSENMGRQIWSQKIWAKNEAEKN